MNTTSYTPEESIAAIATSLSPAALGIVRTSGKNCIELLSHLFSRPKALLEAKGNTIVYGWIVNPNIMENGKPHRIDEVLISVFKTPKSFTGEDMAEISCHGGVAVVTSIYNLLISNGFRSAQRGEYTFRAYLNGKTDLTRAEAVREIIDSRTDLSCGRAAGRLAGDVYNQIEGIKKLIMDTIAAIEVSIEYPEDEETIADSFDHEKLLLAKKQLQELSDSWKSEKLYQDGVRIVLCGKTNAGKSSLFNALLKEDRAIVSDIEGTTRDWIESWVSFDGMPARLFDTAGLRKTDDFVEQKGVERTKDLSKEADIVIYLADSLEYCNDKERSLSKDMKDFLSGCKVPVLFVWNKCDKIEKDKIPTISIEIKKEIPTFQNEIYISAKTGEGIASLSEAVKKLLVGSLSSEREQAGLGSARQERCVNMALESVSHALKSADENYSLDAAVQDLEDSLDSLGIVTGEVTADDILETIFSNFCVGK